MKVADTPFHIQGDVNYLMSWASITNNFINFHFRFIWFETIAWDHFSSFEAGNCVSNSSFKWQKIDGASSTDVKRIWLPQIEDISCEHILLLIVLFLDCLGFLIFFFSYTIEINLIYENFNIHFPLIRLICAVAFKSTSLFTKHAVGQQLLIITHCFFKVWIFLWLLTNKYRIIVDISIVNELDDLSRSKCIGFAMEIFKENKYTLFNY